MQTALNGVLTNGNFVKTLGYVHCAVIASRLLCIFSWIIVGGHKILLLEIRATTLFHCIHQDGSETLMWWVKLVVISISCWAAKTKGAGMIVVPADQESGLGSVVFGFTVSSGSEPRPRQSDVWRRSCPRLASLHVHTARTVQRHQGRPVRSLVTSVTQQGPQRHPAVDQWRSDCRIGSYWPWGSWLCHFFSLCIWR